MKYKDRREQRQVNEIMAGLLVPMLSCLNDKTAQAVEIALRILRATDIDEGSDTVEVS